MRCLGSRWLGLILLGMIFCYLALASLLPAMLRGVPADSGLLYKAWPLKLYLAALVVNVACASMFRIPFRLSRLGAHLAHLGVICLAGGAAWYVRQSVSGYAVAHRDPVSGLFAPVDRFFLDNTAAVHAAVLSPQGPGWRQAALPAMALVGSDEELAARPPVELTIEDASIAATDYLPGAELEYAWRDDGPAACAGVELLLREGARERRVVLCASHAFAASFEGDGYALLFPAEADAGRLAQRARRIRTRVAAIVRPGDGSAKVTVFHPDGSQEDRQIRPGEPGTLLLGGREVKLEIVRFLTRAWRATTARPARPGVAPPAVKLEVRIGNWHGWQWVSQYHSVRPIDPADPSQSRLLLPGGKTLFLQFAPRHRPLPKAFTIAQLRYLTLPGSAIPRDYICSLAVLDDAGGPAEYLDCRLNRPADLGAIRLYQHEWRPDPEDPSEVIFMVRARPGIWAVWLGCGLICAGIPVAFYVGPLRRRQEGRTQP